MRSTGGNRSFQVGTLDDYWSEDYDQNKNCAQGDRIAELRAKVYLYQRLIVCIANILASASLLSQIPRLKKQERCKEVANSSLVSCALPKCGQKLYRIQEQISTILYERENHKIRSRSQITMSYLRAKYQIQDQILNYNLK